MTHQLADAVQVVQEVFDRLALKTGRRQISHSYKVSTEAFNDALKEKQPINK